jgi:iron(II)-dependent oxidoreductase
MSVGLPKTVRWKKDDSEMVLIPAGEFQMGSKKDDGKKGLGSFMKRALLLDNPIIHTVYLDSFYMDKYQVTNAQYKNFAKTTGHKLPNYLISDDPYYNNLNGMNHPVVDVSWDDAKAYADWAGKLLPTEAQWEKAARGGLVGMTYVWGNQWPPPYKSGNFSDDRQNGVIWPHYIKGYNDGYEYTAPVDSFSPNGYGLYDMAGNVWEWVSDWYDPNYYVNSPNRNPTGPNEYEPVQLQGGGYRIEHKCDLKIIRGGSYKDNEPSLKVANRGNQFPNKSVNDIGFRCAMDIPK